MTRYCPAPRGVLERWDLVWWLWGALIVISAGPVQAQVAAESEMASGHFRAGLAHYDKGDFARAAQEFQAAYAAAPNAEVLYNLALASAAARQPSDAVRYFERYLSEGGAQVAPTRHRAVLQTLEAIRRDLAWLEMDVTPADASLSLTGVAGAAEPGWSLPGTYVLTVRKQGYRTRELEVRLQPGNRYVYHVALAAESPPALAPPAWIQVRCAAPDVEVRLDGRRLGSTPQGAPRLVRAGRHRVEFFRRGYHANSDELTMAGGLVHEVDCRLAPDEEGPPTFRGRLYVTSNVPSATVLVDGRPFTGGAIPMGRHAVEVRRYGYVTWRSMLTVSTGQTRRVRAVLIPTADFARDLKMRARVQRRWAYGLAAAGALGGGLSGGLYVHNHRRFEDWSRRQASLDDQWYGRQPASPSLEDEQDELDTLARSIRRVDHVTVGTSVGSAAFLIAAAVLWSLGDGANAPALAGGSSIGVHPGGVGFLGRW